MLVCHDVQAKLRGLAPLVVPKRLIHRGSRKSRQEEGGGEGGEGEGEGVGVELNQTDQEKSLAKDTANLLEVRDINHITSHNHSHASMSLCVYICTEWMCGLIIAGAEQYGIPSSYRHNKERYVHTSRTFRCCFTHALCVILL